MNCPECNAWSLVLETRKRHAGVYRRHECANLHRFSTLDGQLGRRAVTDHAAALLTILREAKFSLLTQQVRDRFARRIKRETPTRLVRSHLNDLAERGMVTKDKKSPSAVYWKINKDRK